MIYLQSFDNHDGFTQISPGSHNKKLSVSYDNEHVHYNRYLMNNSTVLSKFYNRQINDGVSFDSNCNEIISIYGNTIVLNQLTSSPSVIVQNSTANGTIVYIGWRYNNMKKDDKIFILADAMKSEDYVSPWNEKFILTYGGNGSTFGGSIALTGLAADGQWHRITGIMNNSNASNNSVTLYSWQHSAGSIYVKNVYCINLTQMFGKDNEPTEAEANKLFTYDFLSNIFNRLTGVNNIYKQPMLHFNGTKLLFKKTAVKNYGTAHKTVLTKTYNNIGIHVEITNNTVVKSGTTTNPSNATCAMTNIKYYVTPGHKFYCLSTAPRIYFGYYTTAFNGLSNDIIFTAPDNIQYMCPMITIIVNENTTGTGGYIYLYDLTEMFGEGNEPTATYFKKNILYKIGYPNVPVTQLDFNKANLVNAAVFNVNNITGKVNGSGDSVEIFPDGMKSAGSHTDTTNKPYDEITKENGVWVAYKRVVSQKINLNNYSWTAWGSAYICSTALTVEAPNIASFKDVISNAKHVRQSTDLYNTDYKDYIAVRHKTLYISTSDYNIITTIPEFDVCYRINTPVRYVLDQKWQNYFNYTWKFYATSNLYEQLIDQNSNNGDLNIAQLNTSPLVANINYDKFTS